MARDKKNTEVVQDWRHVSRVGAILGAVVGTLVLGAVLRVETAPAPRIDAPAFDPVADELSLEPSPAEADPYGGEAREAPGRQPEADRSAAAPDTRPVAPPPTHDRDTPGSLDTLSRRVADAGQLSRDATGWTLQFMLTCDQEKARRLLADVGDDERLHLLPLTHRGQDCLRVCWGRYADRAEALAETEVPSALRAMNPEPMARPLADLLR